MAARQITVLVRTALLVEDALGAMTVGADVARAFVAVGGVQALDALLQGSSAVMRLFVSVEITIGVVQALHAGALLLIANVALFAIDGGLAGWHAAPDTELAGLVKTAMVVFRAFDAQAAEQGGAVPLVRAVVVAVAQRAVVLPGVAIAGPERAAGPAHIETSAAQAHARDATAAARVTGAAAA